MENAQTENSAAAAEEHIAAYRSAAESMQRLADAAIHPRPDHEVWLMIYCHAVASDRTPYGHSVKWADDGLAEYRKRFTP